MRVEGSNSALTNLRNAPKVGGGRAGSSSQGSKSIGETPPIPLPFEALSEELAELFAPGGLVSKLKRRLNRLKGKKCKVVPAKGTVACTDGEDTVFLGVEFLSENKEKEAVIAGVMAHEWGHACAVKPTQEELQDLNWNEIFELRRAHETLADELSGRLLALMDYQPDGLIEFLTRFEHDTHNLKYHSPKTRAAIIRQGFEDEQRKKGLAKQLFQGSVYSNNYSSLLIDDEI